MLKRAYRVPRERIAKAIGSLLVLPGVRVRAASEVRAALERYPTARAGFADLLVSAQVRAAGCEALATFDPDLAAEGGVVLLA